MSYLLDVNYLIAMFDARHVNHDAAHRRFATFGADWATCSITENGCIRVLSNPSYPTVSATPVSATAPGTVLRCGWSQLLVGRSIAAALPGRGREGAAAGSPASDRFPSCCAGIASAWTPRYVRRPATAVTDRHPPGSGDRTGGVEADPAATQCQMDCQSQVREPAVWYSVTRVSKKFFSLLRSMVCAIHGNGFSRSYCLGRPMRSMRRSAMCST